MTWRSARRSAICTGSFKGTQCALVGIGHPNKKVDQPNALDRFSGSGAFVQVARNYIGVKLDDERVPMGPRRMMRIGGNQGSFPDDYLFKLKHVGKPEAEKKDPDDCYVRVDWSAAEMNHSKAGAFQRQQDAEGEKPTAGDWLLKHLGTNGRTLKDDVIAAGQGQGYTKDALEKARKRDPRLRFEEEGGKSWWWYEHPVQNRGMGQAV